ncbi:Glycosyl hydrolase family 26 [Frankia sp. EI5c]|nr:Glycosyl hydrolase family 26 [Frankia sp. EI5c]
MIMAPARETPPAAERRPAPGGRGAERGRRTPVPTGSDRDDLADREATSSRPRPAAGGARSGSGGGERGSADGVVTGILPVAAPAAGSGRQRRDARESAWTEPAGGGSLPHRATDWIIEHWGAKPGRHPYLPVALVAFAATLALVAWLLGPAQHDESNVAAADPTPTQAVPSPAGEAPTPTQPAAPTQRAASSGAGAVSAVGRVERADTASLFPSGVAAHSMAEVRAWAEFRGSPVDVAVTYTERNSWDAIVNPWMGRTFASYPGDLVISVPLFPDEGPQKGSLTACAAGDYDARWRQFGRWLVAQGRGDSFVRLGWEFNGDWFAWRASENPGAYVQCFRNASSAIKATSPKARIDWNLNAHGPGYRDAFSIYPGDNYVDVIGIDSYDQYPPSYTVGDFERQCNDSDGLCQVISFARQHNKLFSVPEWGVVSQQDTKAKMNAGGDNPLYIQQMFSVFQRNADILAYEAYFSEGASGNVRSSLVNPNQHPNSSATYQRLW